MSENTFPEWQSRLLKVHGEKGLSALRDAHVMVLGLGGVGSNCAVALARAGVGTLTILDKDTVEPSNINRQAVAWVSTIGQKKVSAMTAILKDINPEIQLYGIQDFVLPNNIEELLGSVPTPDVVIDCLDTVSAKLAVAAWANTHHIWHIASMGGANKIDPTSLRIANLEDTYNCPLARVMRKESRKRGIGPVRVLFSTEKPQLVAHEKGERAKEKTLGTTSYMPPIMGIMLAAETIKNISGLGEDVAI